jgi:hypothetical protein
VRSHAKASTTSQVKGVGRIVQGAFAGRASSICAAGSRAPSHGRIGPAFGGAFPLAVAILATLSLAALLFSATPASAAVITDRPLLFSFNGSDTTAGRFTLPLQIAVDDSTGSVYVVNTAGGSQGPGIFDSQRVVDKFNAEGDAQNFTATGKSSLDGGGTAGGAFGVEGFFETAAPNTDVAVDNSAVHPGRVYIAEEGGPVHAFDAQGNFLWTLPKDVLSECGITVDQEGHLWAVTYFTNEAVEFAASGSPPAQIGSFAVEGSSPCAPALDRSGNDLYVAERDGSLRKYVAGTLSSTLTANARGGDVAVDQSQSNGHVFLAHESSFEEFDATDAQVGAFGSDLIGNPSSAEGVGIAVNAAKDWVYVSDRASNSVKVFGPRTTGTVPDVSAEAVSELGVSKVKFNGTINPQSVPNSYHVEWKEGEGASWATAESQPLPYPSIEPTDSAAHSVSIDIGGLMGNTTYQARLVGTNTDNDLNAYSSPTTFTTAGALAAPGLDIAIPSSVTTTSADILATVNPEEDFGTTWRLQLSTDPACATGFSDQPLHELESEATAPVSVSEELTGLLPSQTYCVQITATNSAGTTTSKTTFTTEPVIPTAVFTAFASPRLDTSVRLNGRVNPQGASSIHPLTYRFEYSEDGGATWAILPEQEYSGESRKQIMLSQELPSLTPGMTYSFRFSAENEAGEASSQGATRTFTTRSAAEVAPPDRGIELVNNPDKGNQNVFARIERDSVMSPDGETVSWSVFSGAPGGTASAYSTFLAERSASGWHSHNLIPPAAQQVENANLPYIAEKVTPDFNHFLFDVGGGAGFGSVGKTIVRLDREQHQDVLGSYEHEVAGRKGEVSDNGAHVLIINPDNKQLEDIGGGSPEMVSLMPNGLPSECGLSLEGSSFAGGGTTHKGTSNNWNPGYRLMDVEDASRVYFEVRPDGDCGGPYGLYERNRETQETTLIDPGVGSISQDAEMIRATPDGHHAYFATVSQLDSADQNSGKDVYRWDEGSGESSCLTCVVPNADISLTLNGRQAPILVSDDFSHIYFQSEEQLLPHLGEQGGENTYVLSDGEIHFVGIGVDYLGSTLAGPEALLSSDGNVLVFKGTGKGESLMADQLPEKCQEKNNHEEFIPCQELYRYDDRDGSVECLSCRHDGETSRSVVDFWMSADGRTVAFATPVALSPLDVNQTVDVYEWRDGAVHLVTDGVREFPEGPTLPRPVGVSEDGTTILFTVAAPGLTGFEQDGLSNLYVARIGGGFEPPAPVLRCSEESCQGPLQAPPPQQPPSSSSFGGRGNAKEAKPRPRCAKGKVRRRGSCVKRHTHRKRHKRASHAKQGRTK